ncbi:MAG: Fe-S oxidoreductase [Firmicutes bacterium]|nr:Fe-S oxidoreductase [Bacillota bacterium]MDI6706903.1 B12-binding domain-containing radical SAM protein [Bacillota bacterium]
MKILLAALNSKFVHSSLALRYLKAFCPDKPNNIKIREFTINDPMDFIAGEIFREDADVIAFSTYIWNVRETLQAARRIKKVREDAVIILGGPEVSYDSISIMEDNEYIDYIVRGEGEITFSELMEHLEGGGRRVEDIDGLVYRKGDKIRSNGERRLIDDLSIIPFPYGEDENLGNRIVYYEASRGCPFQCQYCLSSTIKGVRFMPIDRVKDDLLRLIRLGAKQVKFVDRTFNCNPAFAMDIFKFLIETGTDINFHFEISADLMDDDTLRLLREAPPGLFQFEIGVQSTNTGVLENIKRKTFLPKLFSNVMAVKQGENIHQHLDLIAGLPGENMDSFARSFDDVFRVRPDMLQLGFLKLLKGSGIREKGQEYGYIYTDEPPYEVLASKWMSYGDILRLKLVEEVLEIFYNSHRFDNTIEYILANRFGSPYEFFLQLSRYWENNGLHRMKHGPKKLYSIMYDYMTAELGMSEEGVNGLLKYDYLLMEKALVLPEPLKKTEIPNFKQRCFDFLGDPHNVEKYLPGYAGFSAKQLYKQVHFEVFSRGEMEYINMERHKDTETVILFDYSNPERIRGKARICAVEI